LRRFILLLISVALMAVMMGVGAGLALAQQPSTVPPDGRDYGATYGAHVSGHAQEQMLNGQMNPGLMHQGFAGFANCSCSM